MRAKFTRVAHLCQIFPAFAGFCKISIPFLRICAPFTFAPWQTFQDLRSSLSVSQPFRSVGTPPPWSWAATWLTLRTGSSPWMLLRWGFVWGRAAFCLRSALAAFDVHALPWAALRDYFIRRYRTAVVRDRTEQEKTEPNRRKRNHTKMKCKTEKGKPCIIVVSNFDFFVLFSAAPLR